VEGEGSLVVTDRLTSERSSSCIHTNYRSGMHRSYLTELLLDLCPPPQPNYATVNADVLV